MTWRSPWAFRGNRSTPTCLPRKPGWRDRIRAAGGKLHSDFMATIELRHLIVDGAQRYLAGNA